jgi:hypothetical protein
MIFYRIVNKYIYIKKIKNLFKQYLVLIMCRKDFEKRDCRDLHQYNTFVHIVFLYLNICLKCFSAFICQFVEEFAYLRNIVLK